MSDRLVWVPDDPENEPQAKIIIPQGEKILTRQNSSLFTFMGRLSLYDHIYYCDIKEQEIEEAFYIFSFVKGFRKLAKYMMANSFTAHLNMTEVSSTDVGAYTTASLMDLSRADEITDKWKL